MTKLARIIKSRKLKQGILAAQLGISQPFFSQIVNGRRRMSIDICMHLCEILNVEPHEIYEPSNKVKSEVA